ncbi:alkaline phosphatase D family protein [Pseudonocardia eucalypti]|uniref:alkaline phosphatase D family protein n=1 Tax=Pseudonocardia eucalypti TaxID=648755 RepID=UPI0016158354
MTPVSRRTALRVGALSTLAVGAAACTPAPAPATPPAPAPAAPAPSGLFTLGVASGDPGPDGMVLWTRLARDPVHPDGLGGMPGGPTDTIDVDWEVAADQRFAEVLQRGTARTGAELGYAVHVEPVGLPADRELWYRFRAGGEVSPAGRTRTTPAGPALSPLTMCFTSCARYEQGLFTAYRRIAEEHPDLVLHLGDYTYEYGAQPSGSTPVVRPILGDEERTLADYRRRYAQYHADPDLRAAHAIAPWLLVYDDHEVENNWADMVPEKPDPDFPARREAALRAYYENVPLRANARPTGASMRLYRRVAWGGLVNFHMLDTRQYRGDQPCGDKYPSDCPERTDQARGLLGAEQESWLLDGFRGSTARWDLLGQQVMLSQLAIPRDGARVYNPDAWDGYVGQRDRVVNGWTEAKVRNPVVLTGDVHAHWAADVKTRFDDPASPVVGTELVSSSIASGGDGSEDRPETAGVLKENPHIRFFNNRRGYVRTRITPETITADFRVVPYVSRPDAPAETRASFVIEDRKAGLNRT